MDDWEWRTWAKNDADIEFGFFESQKWDLKVTLPVVCRLSSKPSVKVGSSSPKLYDTPATMAIDSVEAAHTTQDQQLSGWYLDSHLLRVPAAWSFESFEKLLAIVLEITQRSMCWRWSGNIQLSGESNLRYCCLTSFCDWPENSPHSPNHSKKWSKSQHVLVVTWA